jgi:hypothetical protein
MLKALAKQVELEETSISRKTLRRLTFALLISLPVWPLLILDHAGLLEGQGGWFETSAGSIVKLVIVLVSLLALLIIATSRLVNRLYFPDRYLDEWEIKIKHKSMTFAFQVLMWLFVPILAILTLMGLPDAQVSGEVLMSALFAVLMLTVYLQTGHAVWQVQPIEDADLDGGATPMSKRVTGLLAVAALLLIVVVGMTVGYKQAHADAEKAALNEVSSVSWVVGLTRSDHT